MPLNIQQEIKRYTDTRREKSVRLEELAELSAKGGESFDTDQKKEFDDVRNEVKTIDEHLERLRDLEKIQATNAKAVTIDPGTGRNGTVDPTTVKAGDDDGGGHQRVIAVERKLDKGIGFARVVKFLALAQGNASAALEIAKNIYPNEKPLHNILALHIGQGKASNFVQAALVEKTAVAGANTQSSTYAGALVQYQDYLQDFLEFMRPQTILGKLGGAVTKVPFKVRVRRQTGGSTANWVGEGRPAPLSSLAFDNVTLDFTKLAALTAISNENLRLATPSAEALIRNDLAAAIAQQSDSDFIDPANSGSSNVKPASVTNANSSQGAATGTTTQAGIATDIQVLFAPLIAANLDITKCVWIFSPTTCLGLSLMQTSLGNKVFPGIDVNGGTFQGLPVISSNAAGLVGASDGAHIAVLLHAPSVLLADDGVVAVDASTEASLEMSDSPTNRSDNGTGASLVSMFQTDSTALKATWWVNWVKGRNQAASHLTAVHWGGFPA